MVKCIVEINSSTVGSTGRIMFMIAETARKHGFTVYTCSAVHGNEKRIESKNHIYIGSKLDKKIHLLLAKKTGYNGCFSHFTTAQFLKKIDKLQPDLIHFHNLHNCYINLPMLFDYVKKKNIPVVWTLHDCWAYTGHCPYYDFVHCNKWMTGCYDCPQTAKGMVYLFGVITIFCSVCVLNAIQGFIPIWVGSEYVLGKDVLIAILATFYVTHAFDPTWMFCETMGLFKERKNAMVINAILNILLSVVLAKPFGMAGILGATAIARVLTIVWWEPYILFKKKFKRPLVDYIKQQAGIIGSNVLIVIFSYMLCSFVSESFMGLIVRIVISGLTVLLVELIFMRKTEEFAWAKNKLKQIIHR